MPTTATVSTPISIGAVGSIGSTLDAPTAAPTPAVARAAPSISASAISSGVLPGNWTRSVSALRTGSRGAMASTWVVSHRPADRAPPHARDPPRWVSRGMARASLRRRDSDRASLISPASSATRSGRYGSSSLGSAGWSLMCQSYPSDPPVSKAPGQVWCSRARRVSTRARCSR